MNFYRIFLVLFLSGCSSTHLLQKQIKEQRKNYPVSKQQLSIDSLVKQLNPLPVRDREKILLPLLLEGAIPSFNLAFKKVKFNYSDSSGKEYNVIIFVSPDYLSIGNNNHFMRLPLTPQAAQLIADSLHSVLPTKKVVDETYLHAAIKLEPQPLTEKRDSFISFFYHDSIIQKQLNFKHTTAVVAGIKKDVVQSAKIYVPGKTNRVAIYGWHQLNGKAIQPLYSGHVDWYVDYSHGVRLVYEKMIINGKIYLVKDVLNDQLLARTICDEAICDYTRYKD